ncbi:MAG: dihydrolipoamide acetyltransferase family protein [Microbacteriaceae bacterium]
MANVVRMPGVSADSEDATLLEWSVETGGTVTSGEPLAVVETEKANVDITADTDGTLWRTLAEPGDLVTVGNPIAVILATGEGDDAGNALLASLGLGGTAAPEVSASEPAVPAAVPAVVPVPSAEQEASSARAAGADAPAANSGSRVFSSPLARKIAVDSGISIDSISGTGPGGRIVRTDVERAVAASPAASTAPAPAAPAAAAAPASTPLSVPTPTGGYTDIPHSSMRRAVANALTGSKRDAPHFYLTTTCRVDALLELRASILAQSSERVSINDLFIKAVGKALRAVPEMNVNWTPDAVRQFDSVDVSVAIASERGLVTPVLRGVDGLSVTQIASHVRDFVERANSGRLKQPELQGGSFTISNLGMFGVEQFGAIINPPQVGILAVGAVVTQPVVEGNEIVVGKTVTVTVSVDHRPVDGVLAARWLAAFREFIENPLTILT